MEELLPFALLCIIAVCLCYLVSIYYQTPPKPVGQKITGQLTLVAPNGATCQIAYTIIANNKQSPIVMIEKLNRYPTG